MNILWCLLPIFVFCQVCSGEYKRVCYVESWARYRPARDRFTPENIDVHLCTHILFAFATLDDTGVRLKADEDGDDPSMYKRFTDLKKRNPLLKAILSVGGWSMGSALFHKAVETDSSRRTGAQNIVRFLRSHNFDGIDIDWEFPGDRGSPAADRHKYTLYLKAIRNAFDKESKSSGKPTLLLSAALNPMPSMFDNSYEVPEIARYFDFINLMFYDMHGTWEHVVGHHAPLYPSKKGDTINVDYLVNEWIKKGVEKSKIIIGVPFYGRTYTLADASKSNIGDKITGPGVKGPLTGDAGTLSYQEICLLMNSGVPVRRLVDQRVPYIVDGTRWTGFDDAKSLTEKMGYIVKHGFGGAMVWSIDQDDFNGICGGETYPLLKAMNRGLGTRIIG
ncbi:chitotriosidase-1 [Patella vulgata]|uniref:chitotriosidase-1 n=1 Tax=Patella vulgata TaxID=6465 RepID=UPI00217F3D7C|nr:chitotriosidase-1 [Patella vulgata]